MSENGINKEFFRGKHDFQRFFHAYYPSLRVFASKLVVDFSVAEDFVQEAFIKLWEKCDSFYSEAAARSFMYTILRNKCLNYLEHNKVIKKHAEMAKQELMSSVEINNQIIEEETHRRIYVAINELPVQCRNILLLSMNGSKNEEIASALKISINTVKTQKKIAYKQLRIRFKDIYSLLILVAGNML